MQAQLQLAEDITNLVNDSFISGEMLEKVSPITRELLIFWFDDNWKEQRDVNFHEGQKQAILNTIYLTEILKVKDVESIYREISPDLILEKGVGLEYIKNDRFSFPRYCYKMATGTGKTWVLSALLIWQYLNSVYFRENEIKTDIVFSSNFLLVAPGLIVYERLLDAFCGKIEADKRNFKSSDFFDYKELFIPEDYRENIFSFVKSSVVSKEEIGRKITGSGQIIISNWHIFLDRDEQLEDEDLDPFEDSDKIIKSLLPATPGISNGNSLEVLDKRGNQNLELEYIKSLKNLVVFNDEAHHLGEGNGKKEKEEEKKWQKAMNEISKNKLGKFLQLDFTATPYIQKGKEKILFPHIIVNFDIVKAMKQGLIKSLVLDKRKEMASLSSDDLEFKAVRNEQKEIISLSKGQEVMLQAGLQKIKILEKSFKKAGKNKFPKMLVVCEDTLVVPFVEEYLKNIGYNEEEYASIHSNKKGEIFEEDKKKVFSLDKGENPKVVISVLMLREGFDVNNICVIVPLRSSQSGILLEQTIGRGLRLMWRGDKALDEAKTENRKRIFNERKSPNNYFDILSVIEHPAFESFYKELMDNGELVLGVDENDLEEGDGNITGEIETQELKSNYKEFDIAFPIILNDVEEIIKTPKYFIDDLQTYPGNFEELKKIVGSKEKFISETVISGTKFGDYDVDIGIMTASSYNDFLARLTRKIADATGGGQVDIKKNSKSYNLMQINLPQITTLINNYIHNKLFKNGFNPLENDNWRILMIDDIAKFIIKELINAVEKAKQTENIGKIEILDKYISEVNNIKIRENFSVKVSKSIFEKLPYPSNKGLLELAFTEFVDRDSLTESFCKIFEFKHNFMRMRYIRDDGIPSYYYPDFIIKTKEKIYLVETKATKDINNENVRRKEFSTISYLNKINELPNNLREDKIWEYVLLSEEKFYSYKKKGSNIIEMLESAKILDLKTTKNQVAIF